MKEKTMGEQAVGFDEIRDLFAMLQFMRPGGSGVEADFIGRYLDAIPGMMADQIGNRYMEIPNPDGSSSTTLWSSHTDTVHRAEGYQRIAWSPKSAQVFLAKKEKVASCLGADCTVGVWIMRRMILANVPGLYVFHAFEESGGRGSVHFSMSQKERLKGITHAIAFDRRGTGSVITHQFAGRTASDEFANAMADRLKAANPYLSYKPDSGGSFTDTANYMDIVSECSNISVGYTHEHSRSETLDAQHAYDLMLAMTTGDFSNLPHHRDPSVVDEGWYGNYSGWTTKYSSSRQATLYAGPGSQGNVWRDRDFEEKLSSMSMYELLKQYPACVTSLLYTLGVTKQDLVEAIMEDEGDLIGKFPGHYDG